MYMYMHLFYRDVHVRWTYSVLHVFYQDVELFKKKFTLYIKCQMELESDIISLSHAMSNTHL